MELKYTTSFDDFIEAVQLVFGKHPGVIILIRIVFPIYIIVFEIRLFDTYPGDLYQFLTDPIIIFWLIFLILEWIVVRFLLNLFFVFLIKKKMTKEGKENIYLIEEKTVIVEPQTLQINYTTRQATIQIKNIYEKNNKIFLYDKKNKVGDIIPLSLFKSDEEKQLFLDIINIPVKKVKNKGRYFKVV